MAELNLVQKRKQKSIFTMWALFAIFTLIFYITSSKTEPITFGFILGDEFKLINEWSVSSRVGSGIFMLLVIGLSSCENFAIILFDVSSLIPWMSILKTAPCRPEPSFFDSFALFLMSSHVLNELWSSRFVMLL